MNQDNYQEAFTEAEASLRLEGLDPTLNPIYNTMKEKVISGEIDIEEACDAVRKHYHISSAPHDDVT